MNGAGVVPRARILSCFSRPLSIKEEQKLIGQGTRPTVESTGKCIWERTSVSGGRTRNAQGTARRVGRGNATAAHGVNRRGKRAGCDEELQKQVKEHEGSTGECMVEETNWDTSAGKVAKPIDVCKGESTTNNIQHHGNYCNILIDGALLIHLGRLGLCTGSRT